MILWILLGLLGQGLCRKHNLHIENDRRQFIPLSTFGFYTGGKLQVNMTGFKMDKKAAVGGKDEMVVGFSIDKTVSDALNPYVQATETQCILTKQPAEKEKAGILRFTLDFENKRTVIRCSKNIRSITILASDSKDADESLSALSDSQMFRPKRSSSLNDPDAAFSVEKSFGSNLDAEIQNYYLADNNSAGSVADDSKKFHKFFMPTPAQGGKAEASHNASVETLSKSSAEKLVEKSDLAAQKIKEKNKDAVSEVSDEKKDNAEKNEPIGQENSEGVSHGGDECGEEVIPLTVADDGSFQTSFVIYIRDAKHEGLYSMFFHNCYNYLHRSRSKRLPVKFDINIEEKNSDSYLSAGEMPLPALYQMLSILFFLSGCFWVFILKKNGTEQVFRIHWIMAALVFLKSLSLFFHGVNYTKIAANGIHEESWAILYYVTHLLKGGLLFFTIVLIGSGWAFVKHVLSSNEKKVFMVVLPAQVISNVAYIILEESDLGEIGHNFWKEVFVLIDLLCCGAILLPVVWSIRHLQDASSTDGKAAVSLEKLKLFRHFYIMVVCYVYFTRIIVYLLKITVPFQYEWLDSMFKEVATLVFFVMTGYKFRPASNNPYFAVPMDDDMEEVLIGSSGYTEQVSSRKSYKHEDMEDEEETVVLFSREGEGSHDLD